MNMTTQNIEELGAHITSKTGARILWYFGIMLIALLGCFYGIEAKIDSMQAQMEIRKTQADGKFDLINNNIENVKNDLKDVKDDVKDLKGRK